MDAHGLIKTFFKTFDSGAKEEFAAFVARQPAQASWLIAADYVVNNKSRPNDVFAFSIMPNSQGLPALQDRIRQALPRDIKKTRSLDESGLALLKAADVFHVAVMLSKKRMLFAESGGESLLSARQTAEELLRLAIRQGDERAIKSLRKVRDFAANRTFAHRLMADVLLLSLLFPAITIALMRETASRDIAWMSDPDKMTGWCGGALWSLAQTILGVMADRMDVKPGVTGPAVCVPGAKGMWFDDMVRLPDYIAGTLATWDGDAQQYASESKIEMLSVLFREVIAGAENLAVLQLTVDERRTGWSRMVFGRD